MKLKLTPEESHFNELITLFVDSSFPKPIRESPSPADITYWHDAVAGKGWTAPEWDSSNGGPGWKPIEVYLWYSLTTRECCPLPDYCALQIVGPLLHLYGDNTLHEAEKDKILNHAVLWGSALFPGNTGITAIRTDNGYKLSGSLACLGKEGETDRILVLAHSEHAYSLFILNTNLDGVTLIPGSISSTMSTLKLNRAQLSRSSLIGHYDKGLEHLVYLLSEKQSISTVVKLKSSLDNLGRIVRESSLQNEFDSQIAEYAIELSALEATGLRSLICDNGQMLQAVNSRVEKLRLKINESITSALGYYSIPLQSLAPGENEPALGPASHYQDSHQSDPFSGCPEGFREDLIAKTMLGL